MCELRPFEFTTGRLALDFVDTVSKRTVEPTELLNTTADLEKWVALSGIGLALPNAVNDVDLQASLTLREAIYRCILAVLSAKRLPPKDVALINELAAPADPRPQLKSGKVTYTSGAPMKAVLSKIAADAVHCLAEPNRDRIRRCPDCKIVFQDNSRANNRIWCSSSAKCGNRAKVRRHRASIKGKQS